MALKKAKKNRALARVLYALRATGGVKREYEPLAKTFGVSEGALRLWEDMDRGGEIPEHQLRKYYRFFGASPALCLLLAEIAEYASQENKEHLDAYAMVVGLLIGRVGKAPELLAVARNEVTAANKYDAVIEALTLAVRTGDAGNRRYILRDKALLAAYRKYEEEYFKSRAEKKAENKQRKLQHSARKVEAATEAPAVVVRRVVRGRKV
jgi:hypothetical protein